LERDGYEKGARGTETRMNGKSIDKVVREFNEMIPVGSPVILIEDDGSQTATWTRSEAWELGSGTPVVKVEGRTGGYLLSRIKV